MAHLLLEGRITTKGKCPTSPQSAAHSLLLAKISPLLRKFSWAGINNKCARAQKYYKLTSSTFYGCEVVKKGLMSSFWSTFSNAKSFADLYDCFCKLLTRNMTLRDSHWKYKALKAPLLFKSNTASFIISTIVWKQDCMPVIWFRPNWSWRKSRG